MAIFGRGYDQDYDFGYRTSDTGYRSTRGRPATRRNFEGGRWNRGYDRDFGWGASSGNFNRYDNDFRRGYDRGYKSQWRTDNGDPFNDRQRHTPMRVVPENFADYDRDFGMRYDRSFRTQSRQFRDSNYPMGYRPWSTRSGYDTGYNRGNFTRRNHEWY